MSIITFILFVDIGLNAVLAQSRSLDFYQESRQLGNIYEDQFIVCNFWNNCIIINADNFMSHKAINKIWNQYDNDLDTFNLTDAIVGESPN